MPNKSKLKMKMTRPENKFNRLQWLHDFQITRFVPHREMDRNFQRFVSNTHFKGSSESGLQAILFLKSFNKSFNYRLVVCRIRFFPTLIFTLAWLWTTLKKFFLKKFSKNFKKISFRKRKRKIQNLQQWNANHFWWKQSSKYWMNIKRVQNWVILPEDEVSMPPPFTTLSTR